jgi:hypothetical protein
MSAVLETELRAVATQVATVVDRIRELEAQADASEAQAIACKYEAARLIAEELERRQGGVRGLAKEIGKSHTHVENMERVHRRHGDKPHVRTLSDWNKLYKGDKSDGPMALNWPKPLPHVRIPTAGGSLALAVEAAKSAIRMNGSEKVARKLVDVIGEDAVRAVLKERRWDRKAKSRKRRSP